MKKATKHFLICLGFILPFCAAHSQNVGITDLGGGITPQSILHLHYNAANGAIFQLTNTTSGNGAQTNGFIMDFEANFKATFKNQYQNAGAGIAFFTKDNGTGILTERVTILNNGAVGIGNTSPDASSLLDITATGYGILIPRMTQANRPGAPVTALLIYQTNNTPGFYYYDGTAWKRLFSGTGDGWCTTGNALTGGAPNTPNEWIGSTNNYDWVIKTNNTEWVRVQNDGDVGIGTNAPNEQLEITKNFRLPATTGSTVGVIYSSANRYIHNYGTRNFFAGATAGNFTLTGTDNTGIGYEALLSNTNGNYNTAVGRGALYTNQNGCNNNTAVGYYSLYTNGSGAVTGTDNTASGYDALRLNTSGDNNTAIGSGASRANTTAGNNTSIGYQTLYNNSTGAGNFAGGYRAFYNGTTGDDNNVAIGYQSMAGTAAFVNSDENVAIGYQSLYSISGGDNNVAVGKGALYSNTSEGDLTAVGTDALYSNIAGGQDNAAFGNYALRANTTGDNNVALGGSALRNNLTAGDNTAVGYCALFSNVSDDNNTALGYNALYTSNGGNDNTALGYYVMRNLTTGDYNTAVGSRALEDNTTGGNNVALGYQAGEGATSNLGGCVYLGYQAGQSNTTANRLFIENSNNIATPLIFGDFANNYVGIGTSAAASTLHINGTTRFGLASTTTGSTIWQNATNANTVTIQSGVTSGSYSLTL
ncbi:MAG: hypothetical protein KKA07_12760, partial [Bacteroidetes bacterium]|nr:hypothetical protein [Bacteroidota bacterium]